MSFWTQKVPGGGWRFKCWRRDFRRGGCMAVTWDLRNWMIGPHIDPQADFGRDRVFQFYLGPVLLTWVHSDRRRMP